MVDQQIVCCMCGDIGFSDKLFSCNNTCCNRFQHAYCSNYVQGSSTVGFCDWCIIEGRKQQQQPPPKSSSSSKKSSRGDKKMKHNIDKDDDEGTGNSSGDKGKKSTSNSGDAPSPRPTNRRYKFLKDVMC
ncbi:hypothetical protein GIB67_001192 [Kingdonia uniflora]|uniref:PHD-type zinc finger plants domain-containing protein n=1 Tax=Kingdonia uniflora TaxID=39325 RepID=A0A7J7LGH9_9MAGN|nr:hypothetical protein GIB67_001192 [Kingdonia uniflora]